LPYSPQPLISLDSIIEPENKMKLSLKVVLATSATFLSLHAAAQITLYENDGFRGRVYRTNNQIRNFDTVGFNDRASSVVVEGGRWEVCDDAGFGGRCMILRRGSYESLGAMGMNDRISSLRRVSNAARFDNEAPVPVTQNMYEYRRRPEERIYYANVTSVRAVMGAADRRCWVERQQVSEPARGDANVGGAILGGILGGVLGHQVGGGRGKDVATALGAVGGGVVGSNVGRNEERVTDRDVRRCEVNQNATEDGRPEYWDVTYRYAGVEHQVQMSSAPGSTIAVNRNGEPRQ
jgi:uncharacterized protein YcfJ